MTRLLREPGEGDGSMTTVWSAVTAVTALTVSASPEQRVKAVTAVTALQTACYKNPPIAVSEA
jgi:hypothetical protein